MSELRRILWSEGLFLEPHHFQYRDLDGDESGGLRARHLTPYEWGLAAIELNRESIANGRVLVSKVEATFPSGLVVAAPERDKLPADREIAAAFPSDHSSLEVFVAVPRLRPGAPNTQMLRDETNTQARWIAGTRKVPDLNTGGTERELTFARVNLKILFGSEALADHEVVRIGEIRRTQEGSFELNDAHIPHCLRVSAAPRLTRLLKTAEEMLYGKSNTLYGLARQESPTQVTYGDLKTYGILRATNAALPLIAHMGRVGRHHPEALYQVLTALCTELMCFHASIRPSEIPPYHHDDLTGTFDQLERTFARLMQELTAQQGYVQLPLEKDGEAILVAQVGDERLFSSPHHFFLVATGDDKEALAKSIPNMVKVAARDQIDALVQFSLRGLDFRFEPSPPGAIPRRLEACYFRLSPDGEIWDNVLKSRTLAFYVPRGVGEVRWELFAIPAE